MQKTYKQLDLEARCEISRLYKDGSSCRQIATALDRSPSTITREIKRNTGNKVGYKPGYAQEQTQSRRWSGSRLERDEALRNTVLAQLKAGLTPQQVAGRLLKDTAPVRVSHESIYRFIFGQIRRTNDTHWGHYLTRRKVTRGYRRKARSSAALCIQERVGIESRPCAVDNREETGHWEADLMSFSLHQQHLLVLHDRSSRLTLCVWHPRKHAESTFKAIYQLLNRLPPPCLRSITFDNGTEFAMHHKLRDTLKVKTYFCDPHSPWQKGGIENSIGRLRRYFPRKTDMRQVTPEQIKQAVIHYNHIPRKCLGYKTPAEVFSSVLHFKCEPTSPPAQGRRLFIFLILAFVGHTVNRG